MNKQIILKAIDAVVEKRIKANRFQAGDVVATPMGTGVVAASLEEDFEFPTSDGMGEENVVELEASSESPVYVVGFGGESGAFKAEDMEKTAFDEEPEFHDGEALASIDELDVTEDDLPDGWDIQSLLNFWADLGDWEGCVSELQGELENPQRICSDRKSLVLGTERWRNRF